MGRSVHFTLTCKVSFLAGLTLASIISSSVLHVFQRHNVAFVRAMIAAFTTLIFFFISLSLCFECLLNMWSRLVIRQLLKPVDSVCDEDIPMYSPSTSLTPPSETPKRTPEAQPNTIVVKCEIHPVKSDDSPIKKRYVEDDQQPSTSGIKTTTTRRDFGQQFNLIEISSRNVGSKKVSWQTFPRRKNSIEDFNRTNPFRKINKSILQIILSPLVATHVPSKQFSQGSSERSKGCSSTDSDSLYRMKRSKSDTRSSSSLKSFLMSDGIDGRNLAINNPRRHLLPVTLSIPCFFPLCKVNVNWPLFGAGRSGVRSSSTVSEFSERNPSVEFDDENIFIQRGNDRKRRLQDLPEFSSMQVDEADMKIPKRKEARVTREKKDRRDRRTDAESTSDGEEASCAMAMRASPPFRQLSLDSF